MRKVALVLICPLLSGCAVAARYEAQTDYQQPAASYKACLGANPSAPQSCESQRLAMETDERKYTNIGAATTGRQGAGSLTVLNR